MKGSVNKFLVRIFSVIAILVASTMPKHFNVNNVAMNAVLDGDAALIKMG